MAIDDLIKALQENPNLEASTETLLPFVDGPEFFERFLRFRGPHWMAKFKSRLYEKEGGLLILIQRKKEVFSQYIYSLYQTLDDVEKDAGLASALGMDKPVVSVIARTLVEQGIMSPDIPDDHSINILGSVSWYIDAKVVGEEKAKENLRKYVRLKYSTLDDIGSDFALRTVLGLNTLSKKFIAKACIEQGLMDAEVPDNYMMDKTRSNTLYFLPEVVGEKQAKKNIGKYVQAKYKSLDDLKKDKTLITALHLSDNNISTIAKACVEQGFLSKEIPENHPIGFVNRSSWYISSEVVGEEQAKKNLKKYVGYTYKTLDDIKEDRALASALGLKYDRGRTLVKAVVKHRLMSQDIPSNHSIGKSAHLSPYIDSEVVGKKQAMRNLRKYVRSTYKTLDSIDKNPILACALGLDNYNLSTLVKTCIQYKFLTPEIPTGHPISKKGGVSWYIMPEIVGEEQARKNLKKYVKHTYQTLDDIRRDSGLVSALKLEDKNWSTIARACVQHGFLRAELPDKHPISNKTKPSWYINPTVVGEREAKINLKRYIQSNYKTLDDIKVEQVVATALGATLTKISIARACVVQGILSSKMPDNHPFARGSAISLYTNPEVVGKEMAQENIKMYVQTNYASLEDLTIDEALSTSLELKSYSVSLLRFKIDELGWLGSGRFRQYVTHSLPPQFRKQNTKQNKLQKKLLRNPIGAYSKRKTNETTTFPKGEALEQLFGLATSYANPAQLVIPQYCLDVGVKKGKGHFRTRVDFKVGNRLYEIKWGKATENIRQTYHKHTKLVTRLGNSSLEYHLVALDEADSIDIPHESFGNFLESYLNHDVKDKFEALAALLIEVSDEITDPKSVDFLIHFRDYVYNLVDKANNKQGDERKKFIKEKIEILYELANQNIEQMEEYMKENTNRFFAPLEAHFEFGGVMYRGFITAPELQKERPDRYETRYYFDKIEFTDVLNRNIAVLLECSPYIGRIEKALDNPKRLQRGPVFRLPNGMNLSTNKQPDTTRIRSMRKLKDLVSVPDDLYDFAMDYIKACGMRC